MTTVASAVALAAAIALPAKWTGIAAEVRAMVAVRSVFHGVIPLSATVRTVVRLGWSGGLVLMAVKVGRRVLHRRGCGSSTYSVVNRSQSHAFARSFLYQRNIGSVVDHHFLRASAAQAH